MQSEDGGMNFASGINRPPYEMADGYLQTTQGCSHNRCLFRAYFKNQRFKKSPKGFFFRVRMVSCGLRHADEDGGTVACDVACHT